MIGSSGAVAYVHCCCRLKVEIVMVEIASDVVGATAKGLCLAVKPIGAFMSGEKEMDWIIS